MLIDMTDRSTALISAMGKLSCREREIIELRYGFTDRGKVTIDECAAMFQITRHWVKRITERAMLKLRREIIKGE